MKILFLLIAVSCCSHQDVLAASIKSQSVPQALSFEDYIDYKLSPKEFTNLWATNEEVFTRDDEGRVLLKNVATNATQILTDDKSLLDGIKFSLSPDKQFLLVAKDYIKMYRYSHVGRYFLVNLNTKAVTQLSVTGDENDYFLFAEWNPKTNGILINHKYDLYYMKSPHEQAIQLTNDRQPGILNGVPDWVYEEELLATNVASWFSPDGSSLAYIRFNDSAVQTIDIAYYGTAGDPWDRYNDIVPIPYPKVGTKNPTVELFVIDLLKLDASKLPDTVEITVPKTLAGVDHIIASVVWASERDLVSVWMNRVQNASAIRKCSMVTLTCNIVAQYSSPNSWVELFTPPLFNKNGSRMAVILPFTYKDDAFKHILVTETSTIDAKEPFELTNGDYTVTDLHFWDADTNRIFYSATLPKSSESRHVYSIKAESGAAPECITCSLDEGTGKYWELEHSPDGKLLVLSNVGPNVPKIFVYKWHETENKFQANLAHPLESNEELRELIRTKQVPSVQFHEIDLENGFTAKVVLQLPPNLDESGNTKYPMLIDVYGAPNYNKVFYKFELDWGSYMASNKSYIYARIDGRGSGLRGEKHLNQIFRRMGTVEVEDQITTARKLSEKLPYIDRDRIGMWGWSYGGFVTAQALIQDNSTKPVIKCFAAVAPVTDWLLYDSIYTERYMGLPTPDNNLGGYERINVNTKAEHFRDRPFLLIHGTRDDNVHFQQSMLLSDQLMKKNILFKETIYPDEDHSLSRVRPSLYTTLGSFFDECFTKPKEIVQST